MEQISFLGKTQSRLEYCLKFPSLGEKKTIEYIQRVIVPIEAKENTKAMLDDAALNIPIKTTNEF